MSHMSLRETSWTRRSDKTSRRVRSAKFAVSGSQRCEKEAGQGTAAHMGAPRGARAWRYRRRQKASLLGSTVQVLLVLVLIDGHRRPLRPQRTTVTPIARAVPMIELQIDCREMNSEPGSVCFTCGERCESASAFIDATKSALLMPLQSRRRASARWSSAPGARASDCQTQCLSGSQSVRTNAGRASVTAPPQAPAAFFMK